MTTTRRKLMRSAFALGISFNGWAAFAQSYPDRPVRLVVGYASGTAPDVLARLLAQRLGEQLGQQFVVDNRPGAGGQIAAQVVAKAGADGYTLLLGEVGSISIAPAAFRKLNYVPSKELAGISEVAQVDFLLAVPADSPHRTVADFVKQARARPGKTNFGTFGAGTSGHFGAQMLGKAAGFEVEPIHYRSTGDAVTAIIAGDVAGAFVSTALGQAQIKGGKMRALATTAPRRFALLPQVPTFAEAGYADMRISSWFALMAPQATPAATLDLLSAQAAAAVHSVETRAKLVEAGFSVAGTDRAATGAMLREEEARWAEIVKASGFRGD